MRMNKPGKRIIGITLALMMAVTPFFSTHAMEVNSPPGTTEPTSQEISNDQNETNETDSSVSSDTQKEEQTENEKTNDSVEDTDQGSENKDAEDTEASEKDSKTTYTSKINGVEITAKLSSAEAIPDDADLKASLITKNSKDYNYDAYMKALNDGKDKEAYTEDNTLLYDLAFMKDGKELEPTEGTVSVTFDFKNDQLSEDLGAKKASDVNVIHLPLKDSVRDKFDSTKAAKSIDEDDINKEEIKDKDLNVSLSNETVKFETKDFSVFAYTVDFTHDEYTYSIAGEDSIMLSDLFKELKIDEDLDNVKDVDFSDPKLIKVTEKDSDWELKSLKPFSSEETLTVTLNNGSTIVITVTDAQEGEYEYRIAEADNNTISLGSDYSDHWYLLSTLTKENGNTYYYVTPITLNGVKSIPNGNGTNSINAYYNTEDPNNIDRVNIGNESATESWVHLTTESYQDGDTVKNELVHASGTAQNYKLIIEGTGVWGFSREIIGDNDVIGKYAVSSVSNDGVGTITLKTLPDFKLKTVFKDSEGNVIDAGSLPNDYKLLIKMVRAGETYYALQEVNVSSNPSVESGPIVFYKYTEQYGNGSIGTDPYYYSGNGTETISTQVVTGADSLTANLIQHRVSGAVFYNENTIGGTQSSDLTKDLFSTSSEIEEESGANIMTTTFDKQKDDGVAHDINVSFYKEHKQDVSDAELKTGNNMNTAANSYFFRVRLYNDNKLVGYKIFPVTAEDAAAANSTGSFTHTIAADEEFKLVDDKGVDIAGGKLHYDPTVYTSDVRLYKANNAGQLPANLSEVSSKGTDVLPGFDFWFNNYSETKVGSAITKTQTDLGLYGAYKKKYQVQIVIDPTAELASTDAIQLFVEAAHQNTGSDKLENINIADGSVTYRTETTSDGKTVITYLIEDQTTDPNTYNWTTHNNVNTISGNETFTLLLKQNNKNITAGYPVKIGGVHYNVSYDTGTEEGKNRVIDDTNDVTTITHFVNLTKAQYDSAITPEEILGDAVEFGIVADTYKQTGHSETNYAVKNLSHNANTDVCGSGTGAMPFYVSNVIEHTLDIDLTSCPIDLYIPADQDGKLAAAHINNLKNSTFTEPPAIAGMPKLTEINLSHEEIEAYVDSMIQAGREMSETLASRSMIKPALSQNEKTIDTTMFPDNTTIYVDCSDCAGTIGTSGWIINKLPGQSIVFNIPGKNVTVGEFTVNVYDENGNKIEDVKSNTDAKDDGTSAQNRKVDRIIFDHISFNAYEAETLDLHNASALFLAPLADRVTQENGAGWILAKGTVDSTSEWHFYRHTRHYHAKGDFTLKAIKKILSGGQQTAPGDDRTFTFDLYERDNNDQPTGKRIERVTSKKDGSLEFSKIKYTEVQVPQGETRSFHYIIKEVIPSDDEKLPGINYTAEDILVDVEATSEAASQSTGHANIAIRVFKVNKDGTRTEINNTGIDEKVFEIGDFINEEDTGTLELSKTVVSDAAADADQKFNFTVTLGDTTINGEYGDMTFTNGVATVELKGGDSVEATGLPIGVTYTVTEADAPGFELTKKVGEEGTISATKSEAEFTNTRETGNLEVKKTVTSSTASDKTKDFDFTVTLSDTTINGEFGEMTFTNGVATFTLKDGETKTAEGLPTGITYTVTETDPDGFVVTKSGDTGAITTTKSEAQFTNTKKEGGLIVSKSVTSPSGSDKTKDFTFTVTLDDTSISGTYGGMTFDKGVATFTLKDGETKTATGLPDGVGYTVTETADNSMTTTSTGETGAIVEKETKTAEFVNTRKTGDLELSKTVVSDAAADAEQEFTFTVTLDDKTISGKLGDMTFTEGVATVTLKGGEKATATGLPTGIEYTITEADTPGFQKTAVTGDTGTISETKSEASFTNTREKGDLELSKTVVSDAAADADQKFTFTVTLSDTTISGKYGDMTFTDGVATVELKGKEKVTATGLPTGITYTITEADAEGFQLTGKTGDTGTISKTKSEASFTNTRETGDLKLSKTVVSDAAADADQVFNFTVTLGDTTINGTYGGMTFTNGVATVDLKGGEEATATGLPTGITYTITEAAATGFKLTGKTGATGTISKDLSAVEFTNTREQGDLAVTKTVTSSTASDKTKDFNFTVTLSDTTISGEYGDMTFSDGVATFTLKDGETAEAKGLPTGITYTVEEETYEGFVLTKSGDTGEITTTKSQAQFTNTKKEGGLIVSKSVTSAVASDKEKDYSFTVTLDDKTITGTYGGMTFKEGVATFTLKDGKTATATGLPEGIEYTVTEETYDNMTTTYTGKTGTIQGTTPATAAFVNTRDTGDLELSKKLVSDAAADKDRDFVFTVTLDEEISGTFGDMVFDKGVATVTLKGGQSAKAEGLPVGVGYTITEAQADGFTLTDKTGDEGTISKTASEAKFENTRKTGDLNLKKTLISKRAADANQKFTFTVELSDKSISGTYGDMKFEAGVAKVELKGGESAKAEGLPTGITYTITEADATGFERTGVTGASGTISETASEAEFTNTRETGDLEVSKTVTSSTASDKTKKFAFTVTLSDTTINGEFGQMTFENGVATFNLTHGEKATATGLPTDIEYTVTEETYDGFVVTKSGDTGEIKPDPEVSKAKFTNAKKEGGLIVTKSVTSSEASDKTRAYEFTVTLGDTTINGKYGDMTFENGVATFELKDTETAEAKGLPEGVEYTVVEKTYNNMTTTKTGDTGKIPEGDEPAVAAFVNTRNTGDLELSKTVVSDAAADANQKFTFTVTMNDETFSGTYGDMTFENGVATVELKGGEKATATGLPAGIGYSITETQVDGFTMTGHPGDSGTITEKTSQAVFTNTRDTGELVLSKTLISDRAADADQIFEFTVTLSDPTINSGIFNAITKTYGGMNFKDGVAKVKLQGGQQVKAENLPTGLTYTITEESAPGFVQTGKTGDTGTISTTQSTATFENTRETGDLELSKVLISDAAADKDQKFTFTVTLDDKSISGEYGDMTFTNGVATVELKGGERATAEGLPTDVKYTITEANAAGFEMTDDTGYSGEISTKPSTAVFTNKRKTGDLEVSKTVVSSTASDKTKDFDFTVTLSDTTINGTYGDMTFKDGVATFKLQDNKKKTATGLPTGISYTVTETDPDGFTVTKTGDTGQITTTKSQAQFTNTKEEGGLIVTKSVVSPVPSDTTKEYSFTVTLEDKSVNGTYGDMTFNDGVAKFTLKSGQTKSATGLAKGIEYTVTEETCANMITTSTGETGEIEEKKTQTAAFVNTRETGELELSKELISDAAADKTRAFIFTVTLGDTSIEGLFGGMTFAEGVATVSLKGGEKVTATGLPAGVSYEITEADADGFTLTGKTGETGTIGKTASKAEFTNTRDTGDLKVSKVVISDAAADADQEFTFAVVLRDATINGKYGDMTFKDGMATVNLKGGESKTATGLPTGLGYEITEDDTDGFELTGKTGDTGTISKELSEAIFTNTRETGGLMLSKELISDIDADADQVFTFTVTLNDTTINSGIFDLITKTYGDMTFKDGVATVELKGGESATAENLPTGITYTITEADAPGFELTATTGDSGTISTTRSEAAFTNTRVTTSVTLGGGKAFENGDLTKNRFEFGLYEKDGEEPLQTTFTDAQGNFQFTPIEYTLEDLKEGTGYAESKDFEYVIKEIIPETADENGFDAETGIQYDLTERPATVTVSQTEDGKLEATNSLGETGAQFTNEQFTKLKLTKTIDGYNAGDTEGEFTNATLVFKVTYKVDDEEIVRYMNVQYNADTGAVTTAELDKIPIDAEISVDEVYSDNYESEQTSDIELVTDEETGERYYTVSFDNTLKRIEHGSGIINKYEKDASGNFHLQYRIKDGTNPQEPK